MTLPSLCLGCGTYSISMSWRPFECLLGLYDTKVTSRWTSQCLIIPRQLWYHQPRRNGTLGWSDLRILNQESGIWQSNNFPLLDTQPVIAYELAKAFSHVHQYRRIWKLPQNVTRTMLCKPTSLQTKAILKYMDRILQKIERLVAKNETCTFEFQRLRTKP